MQVLHFLFGVLGMNSSCYISFLMFKRLILGYVLIFFVYFEQGMLLLSFFSYLQRKNKNPSSFSLLTIDLLISLGSFHSHSCMNYMKFIKFIFYCNFQWILWLNYNFYFIGLHLGGSLRRRPQRTFQGCHTT